MAETKEPTLITATEASRAFSDLLHRVCYGGESFIIKKGQRLMARVVPVVADVESHCAQEAAPLQDIKEPPVGHGADHEQLLAGLTQEEAEYYRTVVEQIRSAVPEPADS